jgi:hypothetical protein
MRRPVRARALDLIHVLRVLAGHSPMTNIGYLAGQMHRLHHDG